MKKTFLLAAIAATTLSLTSCFSQGGTTGNAIGSSTTNTNHSSLTSGGTGTLANAGAGLLGNLLSTLLGGATTSQQSIIGTWTYQAPEVRFESENVLSQLGGQLVSQKIESALDAQLSKIGMKKGVSKWTFSKDGSLSVTLGGKTVNGTYTLGKDNVITMTGVLGLAQTHCTVAVQGDTLYMLFDSNKLLSMATRLTSSAKTTSSLSKLLGNYTGLKLGWNMTR